jgi:threonine/homoserine/homoserine lactone efflux protein
MGGEVVLNTFAIALSGIVVGIFSAVLPLGPVTVLVLRRVLSGDPSGALRIGLGRVPAEVIYCALATFGTAALLHRFPAVRTAILVSGTVVLLVVGAWLVIETVTPRAAEAVEAPARRWGDAAGLIISLVNPSYLFSYSAIVAIGVSTTRLDPTVSDKLVFPLAVGCGVSLGYRGLIGQLRRHSVQAERVWVQRAIRAMGSVLVGLALCNMVVFIGGH